MKIHKIKSYAKINLALNVTGKNDKLHKIESIVTFINLYDLIYLKPIKKKNHKISFKGKFSENIGKINTVTTLLNILDKKDLLNGKKFEIIIIKNIPQKSGLGGGSMNAAFLINFLIKKNFIKIGKIDLRKIVTHIGSDVTLGINEATKIMSSNGKIIKYNKNIRLHTLVVKPNFGCSTKHIYSNVKSFSKSQFNLPKKKMLKVDYLKILNNDLEKIAFKKYPKLKIIKSFLLTIPNILFARMSGSGSSIVAYFHSKGECSNAYKQFKRKFDSHWCIVSKTI